MDGQNSVAVAPELLRVSLAFLPLDSSRYAVARTAFDLSIRPRSPRGIVTLMRIPLRGHRSALVIAHRGASAQAPENTLPAFDAAWNYGASWVEADVQPTADGGFCILHDDTVDRTTNGQGAIRDLTSSTLHTLDAGSWFNEQFAGTGIPTLTELLDRLGADRYLLLELKGEFSEAQLACLWQTIRSHPAADQVALQSFELPILATFAHQHPTVELGLLREVMDQDPVELCQRYRASSYNPDYQELLRNPAVVDDLHRAGIAIAVWTCDDPDAWAQLTGLGVDAIITNTPAEFIAWQMAG